MLDYKRMYYIMCDAASRAIDDLPHAGQILQMALDEAEEVYIRTCGPDLEARQQRYDEADREMEGVRPEIVG